MKKILIIYFLMNCAFSNAQLMPNSIAPDFTITALQPWLSNSGLNGDGTYNLYEYLDLGYTVYLDFSTTWCSPCWDYHTSGIFDDLYKYHGPLGFPGVDPTTTDDIMVFWIETDNLTNDSLVYGLGSNTLGNWTEPTPGHQVKFPVVNLTGSQLAEMTSGYNLSYSPMIMKICPDRKTNETGPLPLNELIDEASICYVASSPVDVKLEAYNSIGEYCLGGDYTPVVTVQNYGTNTLTNVSVSVYSNNVLVSTGTSNNSLATYDFQTINCTPISNPTPGMLTIKVDAIGDADTTNNVFYKTITESNLIANASNATVKMTTDFNGSDITWEIKNSSDVTIASGGPYNDGPGGINVQANSNFSLSSNECYTLTLSDKIQGNGFDSFSGDGSFKLVVGGQDLIIIDHWNSIDTSRAFITSESASVGTTSFENDLTIYPNPASDFINIQLLHKNELYSIQLFDIVGRIIYEENFLFSEQENLKAIHTNHLVEGNYFIKISSPNESFVQTILIK